MILASACPLRIGAYTSLYPCGKTHISSSFWKKQAYNNDYWHPMEETGNANWKLDYIFSLYVLLEEHGLSKTKKDSGWFFFWFSPTKSIVL
jgi:hypothetical protein